MVRPKANVAFLEPMGVRIVHGELDDLDGLSAAMRGADAVIHTAGNTSCNPRDLPALEAVNVQGHAQRGGSRAQERREAAGLHQHHVDLGTLGDAGDRSGARTRARR